MIGQQALGQQPKIMVGNPHFNDLETSFAENQGQSQVYRDLAVHNYPVEGFEQG